MDHTLEMRQKLLARLLGLVLVSSGAAVSVYGCTNPPTSTGGEGGSGGTGGAGGEIIISGGGDPFTTTQCFTWPQAASGGAGGIGGSGGAGGTGGSASTGGAGGIGGMGMGGAGGGAAVTCPPKEEAPMYIPPYCGTSGVPQKDGVYVAGECCYEVLVSGCGVGRPYVEAGHVRTARAVRSRSIWTNNTTLVPDLSNLSADDRVLLAEAWTRDGLLEHASIASFGRFALELLAVGAPASLIELAHQAALDEVRHARIAFEFASTYAGTTIAPGAFPFAAGSIEVSCNLADVAARAVVEGCIGETLASMVAAEQALHARDPAVRQALERIADDEGRHAELAWRMVVWAFGSGDALVQRAIADAFTKGLSNPPAFEFVAGADGALEAHGRPAGKVLQGAIRRTLDEVVRPAVTALVGQSEARPDLKPRFAR